MLDILAALIVIFSFAYAVRAKDLLAATIATSLGGLGTALYFLSLHAPDVAMAEAAVGAGLVPLIFVVAIVRTKRFEK
ncbi:MAG: DUF4040 domain-containing protein [Candidatus Micrarchaeota archaeon]|nr:DUF4040 domain-containing protein [Candidatus Micrarchaeota archaeon]